MTPRRPKTASDAGLRFFVRAREVINALDHAELIAEYANIWEQLLSDGDEANSGLI